MARFWSQFDDRSNQGTAGDMTILRQAWRAFLALFYDGGFAMAGAMAFSLVLAIFPFFMFVSGIAGFIGGAELAAVAAEQIFQMMPREVAAYLVPQIEAVLGQERYSLLTYGGLITLFFASNGIESLRWALNTSYEDDDQRSIFWLRLQSFALVIMTALVMLFLAYTVVIAPLISSAFGANLAALLPHALLSKWLRIIVAFLILVTLLFVFHAWLPARRRSLAELWPGIAMTIILWGLTAYGFSYYLDFTNYSTIYAGLSQAVIALIFFYLASAIMIYGAEFNHARALERRAIQAGPART